MRGQKQVDVFKMTPAVVTRNAREVDAQKCLGVEHGQLVGGIELLHHAEVIAVIRIVFALHVLARDEVRGRDNGIALGRSGDDGAHNVVIGPVDA